MKIKTVNPNIYLLSPTSQIPKPTQIVTRTALKSLAIFASTVIHAIYYTINLPVRLISFAAHTITSIFSKIFFLSARPNLHNKTNLHNVLTIIAAHLGYKPYDGLCNGLARMGIQAALIGDIDSFNNRIQKLHLVFKKHYGNIDLVIKEIEKDPNFKNECLAFFDGITLWQRPNNHKDLLEKSFTANTSSHIKSVTPITASEKLNSEGGMCQFACFSGLYNEKELTCYLLQLKKVFHSSSATSPIALHLSNKTHAISIAYDPKKDSWLFIDANRLPVIEVKNEAILANKLWNFSECELFLNPRMPISTRIYTLKKNSAKLKKHLSLWFKTKEYQSLHCPSNRKKQLSHNEKSSWLFHASINGELRIVNALLADRVNPNITDKIHGSLSSCLDLAIINNHSKIVKALLNSGANPNLKETTYSPLICAIFKGHLNIVNILLAHKANPNLRLFEGVSPLDLALSIKRPDICKALLDHGAK